MEVDFDKEVQKFGPYEVVIRRKPAGNVFFCKVWRGNQSIAYAEKEDREAALEEAMRQMGVRQLEMSRSVGAGPVEAQKVADAFKFLWRHLNPRQQTMLKSLHEHTEMSVEQLAEAAAYKNFGGVNLWLGIAGAMFGVECPRGDLQIDKGGDPVPTSWFCLWDVAKHTWTIRPEVAEGMRIAGCVSA